MTTLVQSLSWALLQSFVQGVLVYLALSVLLWTIPAGRSRLRYNLSFFAMIVLSLGFILSWWKEFQVLTMLTDSPLVTLPASSLQRVPVSGVARVLPSLVSNKWFPLLGGAYIAGISLMVARLLIGVAHVMSLRHRGTRSAPEATEVIFYTMKSRLEIKRGVKMLVSVKAKVPMVVGMLKPVILVPAAAVAGLDEGQLEAILLHELAHVKRYDYLANIVQAAIETILFFNPFLWLISSAVRDERERCCDDIVVGLVGEPISYATALTAVASYSSNAGTFAVAATGHKGRLFARVQGITEGKDFQLRYSRVVASIALLLALIVSVAWVKPAFNSKTKKATVKTAVSKAEEVQAVADGGKKAAIADKPKVAQPAAILSQSSGDSKQQTSAMSDENILVNRLLQDRVVDQVKGFLVERHFKELYINRQMLPSDVSGKYLQGLSKDIIRVQVFPMEERMRMHPDANFIQLLLPFSFESPCIDKPTTKEGC